jgi:TROVE domain-containing protein
MPFNTKDKRAPRTPGPIATQPVPTGLTGNGAPGFAYEDKSALFLMATTSFFGQDKFYAKAPAEDERFVQLVRKVTRVDPVWMLNFITWLRENGNMRTSAVVASVEAALIAKNPGMDKGRAPQAEGMARKLAKAGIKRADEIGEALAYYKSKHPAGQIPKPIKRGLADAFTALVNQYTAMKYGNSDRKEYTPDRLIQLLHPAPSAPWQSDLFAYLVKRAYEPNAEIPASLLTLHTRRELMALPVSERRALLSHGQVAQMLKAAGMTWEALAGWLQGPMDKAAWEAIIPSMGYFALLRNLRNFDEVGVSHQVAAGVANTLSNPEKVAKSKLFPFRFLAALKAAPSLRWSAALAMALEASLGNIPALPGRSLVMVDTSGSMNVAFSEHSEMKRWDAAALFGIALAIRNPGKVDVVSYSNHGRVFEVTKGADVLGELNRWGQQGYNLNGGTNTFQVTSAAYRNHDRVIILTDEQVSYGHLNVPADRHVFTFNLAGYQYGQMATNRFRHSFGGLTDACFSLISQIEAGVSGLWPWEGSDV